MLGNDLRDNNLLTSKRLEYPLENLLTKIVGRFALLAGCCAISAEAVIEADPGKLMLAAYGVDTVNNCVNLTADTCCPPIQREPTYRPYEMDLLEDSYDKKLR